MSAAFSAEDLAAVAYAAGASVSKALLLIGVGIFFGWLGWVGRAQRSAFALLTAYALQPAFFCVGVTYAIIGKSSAELVALGIFPLGAFWHIGLGALCSAGVIGVLRAVRRAHGRLAGADEQARVTESRFEEAVLLLAVAFPNSAALPIPLLESLCTIDSSARLLGAPDEAARRQCVADVSGFVAIYVILFNPMQWGLAPIMFSRAARAGTETRVSSSSARAPPVSSSSARARLSAAAARALQLVRYTPPTLWASAVGVLLAMTVPPEALEPSSPFGATVWSALQQLAGGMIPLLLVSLGASLGDRKRAPASAPAADAPAAGAPAAGELTGVVPRLDVGPPAAAPADPGPSEASHTRLVATAAVLRLLVVPLASIPVIFWLTSVGVLPRLPRVTAVLMLEAAPPAAAQLSLIVIMYAQPAERLTGKMLLVMNVLALPALVLWISVILLCLSALYGDEAHPSRQSSY